MKELRIPDYASQLSKQGQRLTKTERWMPDTLYIPPQYPIPYDNTNVSLWYGTFRVTSTTARTACYFQVFSAMSGWVNLSIYGAAETGYAGTWGLDKGGSDIITGNCTAPGSVTEKSHYCDFSTGTVSLKLWVASGTSGKSVGVQVRLITLSSRPFYTIV